MLFDIDGTLLDADGAGRAALFCAMREELGEDVEVAPVSIAGRTDRGILADLLEFYQLGSDEKTVERLFGRYLAHLPRQLEECAGHVLPGVPELLAALEEMEGVHIGLLTGNVKPAAFLKLRHHGIHNEFPFGGFGGEHADRARVAAAALEDASHHLGRDIDPAQTVVVGDTPNDIRCARSVGACAVAVETGFSSPAELRREEPDRQLADLSDLDAVIDVFRDWL